MAVVRDLRVLLRLRDFRRLLAVRLLSQSADGMYQTALAAHVVFSPEKQATPAAIASAMAVLLLPYSLVGPFVGVLLDRWQRRQVLLHGNLLRSVLATGTALLILAQVPQWLFYVSALSVTAVNRFVLAGLSAALPHVVDDRRLVVANSLSPTAGTLAAIAGGGLAIVVRIVAADSDAVVVLVGAALYLSAAAAALRMGRRTLGPTAVPDLPRVRTALAHIARGLASGVRHLHRTRPAARALSTLTGMRFAYGAFTVMLLMLCRYAWSDTTSEGLALLGVALGVSGAGFFTAAVITPWMVDLFRGGQETGNRGRLMWLTVCAGASAVLLPALALPFAPGPMLAAAFLAGLATQGAKIATDSVIQSSVSDIYRGRIFSLYDVLFNAAFVAAAAVAALMLPPDGRSPSLVATATAVYLASACWAADHLRRG